MGVVRMYYVLTACHTLIFKSMIKLFCFACQKKESPKPFTPVLMLGAGEKP